MWELHVISHSSEHLTFQIRETEPVSNQGFLQLLRDSEDFRQWYNQQLADCGFEGFFWENKPFTSDNPEEPYECNLLQSEMLARGTPDSETFRKYFSDEHKVVCFDNLGGDARLVVPSPINEVKTSTYTHLGSFVRNAPQQQISQFWQAVGREMLSLTGNRPVWLSTHGLGVYWLHARIDTVPKYYHTSAYKQQVRY